MGRRKVRKCRICKKSPVWRGGDVKNPGPFCKRCYHKHVWTGGKGSGRRAAADGVPKETEIAPIGESYGWLDQGRIDEPTWDEAIDGDPESIDDYMIPF